MTDSFIQSNTYKPYPGSIQDIRKQLFYNYLNSDKKPSMKEVRKYLLKRRKSISFATEMSEWMKLGRFLHKVEIMKKNTILSIDVIGTILIEFNSIYV